MARHSNLDRIHAGQKTVTANGTAEILSTGFAVPAGVAVIIKAMSANTNDVFLGHTKAIAESATDRFALSADQAVSLQVANLKNIWLDSTTNGEGVEFLLESDVIA